MESVKKTDRLNYSIEAHAIIEKLDEKNFFGFSKPNNITRSELFLLAMALGIDTGTQIPLVKQYQGGLVLDKSIDEKTKALMHALFLAKLEDPSSNIDDITKKSQVFKMAEEYANTGFHVLDDYMTNHNEEHLMLILIEELDEQFEKIKQSNPSLLEHE